MSTIACGTILWSGILGRGLKHCFKIIPLPQTAPSLYRAATQAVIQKPVDAQPPLLGNGGCSCILWAFGSSGWAETKM